ncbi:MAG TPA: S4 domain-containing protein [Candidatus Saccharimonadales bacterium]|nr:S4 domain-containing protein [Candidatus Saccharimonadales bacterium]
MDVFLHWTCLARSRSEAGRWCHEGHVRLDGTVVKASHAVRAGQRLDLALAGHSARYEVLALPRGQCRRGERERYLGPAPGEAP